MSLRVLTAVLAVAALTGCAGAADPPPPLQGRVTRVVDGDTVRVRLAAGGRDETVRYIGVDTPETARSPRGAQCFGARAAGANARLAAGERVALQPDRERRDRYGRLLAYVSRSRDALDLGGALVREGYARALTIRPNDRRSERYTALARSAQRARRGLWAACRASR